MQNPNVDVFQGPAKTVEGFRFSAPLPMPRGTKYGSDYFIFKSLKTGQTVETYSHLEFCNLIRLEMDSEVQYYCPQPFTCSVTDENGNVGKATFDVWVLYTDGREEMQEVKYKDSLTGDTAESRRAVKQLAREKEFCEAHNIDFVLRTEDDIRGSKTDVTIQNLVYLAGHVWRFNRPEDSNLQKMIMKALEKDERIIDDIFGISGKDKAYVMSELAVMYYKGKITMELNKIMICAKTIVRRKS